MTFFLSDGPFISYFIHAVVICFLPESALKIQALLQDAGNLPACA